MYMIDRLHRIGAESFQNDITDAVSAMKFIRASSNTEQRFHDFQPSVALPSSKLVILTEFDVLRLHARFTGDTATIHASITNADFSLVPITSVTLS
jgi:hypothetical protein